MSTLYDGTDKKLTIPNIKFFTENYCKNENIPDMSRERIEAIFKFNCFGYEKDGERKTALYPFVSLINHCKTRNIVWYDFKNGFKLVFVLRDIKKGE